MEEAVELRVLPVYQAAAEIKPRASVNMVRTLYFMKKGLLYEHAILSVAAGMGPYWSGGVGGSLAP